MKQKKQIRKFNKILYKIRELEQDMRNISDEELSGLTAVFKKRLAEGETLDMLLPEAFAAVCEADRRILGMSPYDVQILGGIALHQGYLAEMNTGEGKTLTATMPLYLNALTGKSTILVTANGYLAARDAEEMGQVYRFMGLSIESSAQEAGEEPFTNEDKKRIYGADIVYTTHGILGFDYLLNNLVNLAQNRFLREFYFVIIDEADSVLLDAAQMPLVISGSPRVQSNLYELADFFVTTLTEGEEYEIEDKAVWLTPEGIRYAEQFFRIDNFYDEKYFEINRHVTLALRAHTLFQLRKDYMVSKDTELALLDGGSGRMLSGVKLRGGQHQALEAKEKLKLTMENRSMASVTYQNLFLMFPKMSGMSGTVSDATDELRDIYGKKVIKIPTNRPLQRKDLPDLYFKDADSQIKEAVKAAIKVHRTGQPVLIVVSTIGESETVSRLLIEAEVPHNVLNANNAAWEASIIKEAGQKNAVTVSTAMAGRGTDIKLGTEVKELGGLAVIGIGRMSNVRQERQARGRSGRQGDPGFSQFYVSLEDEIVYNSFPKLDKYIEGKKHISKHKLKKIINSAQPLNEESAVMSRQQAMSYDQVLSWQRRLIYAIRDSLLDGEEVPREKMIRFAEENIDKYLAGETAGEQNSLSRYILDNISYHLDEMTAKIDQSDKQAVKEYLLKRAAQSLKEQEKRIGDKSRMNDFIRVSILKALDEAWVEQVDYLQQLQQAVGGRSTAQRNPVFEYQKDSLESFEKMKTIVIKNAMRNILLSGVTVDEKQRLHIVLP